jgi:hypothetical protein
MARSTAHAVIAINHRHGRLLAHHPDVGPDIDAARLDSPAVLRQADDAVAIRALEVGLRHQRGDLACIGFRQTLDNECRADEIAQRLERDSR